MNKNIDRIGMSGVAAHEGESGFTAVAERFPGHREVLTRLFTSDLLFRSLCDEYKTCLGALRYWRESNLPEAPGFRNEFSSLLSELEEEIEDCLNKEISD